MKSLTLTGTSVVLGFDSAEERDSVLEAYRSNTPREVHSRARSGDGDGGSTLTIRLQDIVHPVTIPLDGGEPIAPKNMSATTGLPTHLSRFTGKDPENVPGAAAEARVFERETTSGENLMAGTPGAVNNDPSTATNAGYEGSPAQAIQSATDGFPPTPGGFVGKDKAAVVKGAAPGTAVPAASAERLFPEGQQDAGSVNVQRAADTEAKEAQDASAKRRDEATGEDVNGNAKPAETAEELEANNTKEELSGMADKLGITVKSGDTKADIAEKIVDARKSK